MAEKIPQKPKCFIIMPLTTPITMAGDYGGDTNHFVHVLDCLFCPAVTQAGYEPIRPNATGAQLIHANIISELQSADLVLCDMSTLNANVFMELGVRTALNKPVCMVRDDKTPDIPFDTNSVNCCTYSSSLVAWVVKETVTTLTAHIEASAKSCDGGNPLWKYFGLTSVAKSPASGSRDERFALLSQQIERLSSHVQELTRAPTQSALYGWLNRHPNALPRSQRSPKLMTQRSGFVGQDLGELGCLLRLTPVVRSAYAPLNVEPGDVEFTYTAGLLVRLDAAALQSKASLSSELMMALKRADYYGPVELQFVAQEANGDPVLKGKASWTHSLDGYVRYVLCDEQLDHPPDSQPESPNLPPSSPSA